MVNHGKRWGALPWLTSETLGWVRGLVRTKSWRNAPTSLKCLINAKVSVLLKPTAWETTFCQCLRFLFYVPVILSTGKAFDTAQPMNRAVSNIICSIVYGSRFEYDDPEFTSLVERTNRNIQLLGSPSIQVLFHMFIKLRLADVVLMFI